MTFIPYSLENYTYNIEGTVVSTGEPIGDSIEVNMSFDETGGSAEIWHKDFYEINFTLTITSKNIKQLESKYVDLNEYAKLEVLNEYAKLTDIKEQIQPD